MYRDDHEAALARVTALEEELAREQADDTARDGRIAELERELGAAKVKLRRAEAELDELRPPPPPPPAPPPSRSSLRPPEPASSPPPRSGVWRVLLVVGLVAFAAIAVGVTRHRATDRALPPAPAYPRVLLPDQVSELLVEARGRSARALPGAWLAKMRGEGIDELGQLHAAYGSIRFEFRKENPPPPPPPPDDRPIGAPPPPKPEYERYSCVTVERSSGGWTDYSLCHDMFDMYPRTYSPIEPRCTMRSIWAMALVDGAPRGAIAKIELEGDSWSFKIDDERVPFERRYDDDCVPPSPAERSAP